MGGQYRTIAFLIGNNAYGHGFELRCAVNDAHGMADVFRRLGYDVTEKCDCTVEDCTGILECFKKKIELCDASIFYYAGHGFEYNGENYLAPVGFQLSQRNSRTLDSECINLSDILDIHAKNPNIVNIVIIDACRNRFSFDRSLGTSFAPMLAPKGTLIAFSTSPNEAALDGGAGDHSVYTGALLEFNRKRIPLC